MSQGISSGTNFLLSLYLIKVLTPVDFGLFGISFAVILLFSGFGNALFLTPMVVNLPNYQGNERLDFLARNFFSVLIFCMFITFLIFLIKYIGFENNQKYSQILIPTALASSIYLIKDLFIRYAYSNNKEIIVLIMHISTAISLSISILIVHYFFFRNSIQEALSIYIVAQLFSLIVAFSRIKIRIYPNNFKLIYQEFVSSYADRAWSLLSVISYWLQGQAYMYVTAFNLGPQGVAQANAAKLYISPAQIIMPAIGQIVFPKLVNLSVKNKNSRKLILASVVIMGLLASAALIYSIVLILLFDYISPLITATKYANVKLIMYAWCVLLVSQFAVSGVNLSFQANKEFRLVSIVSIFSAILGIAITVLLIKPFGVFGAVLGSASSNLIMTLALLFILFDKYSKLKNEGLRIDEHNN